MAGYRQPGVLCVTTALPCDAGTLARGASPCPTPVGRGSERKLSDYDLEFIRTTAGRNIDGSRKPLHELQNLLEAHVRRKAARIREWGAQSWAVLFEQAAIECISALIEDANSPSGKAAEQLRNLIEDAKKPGSADTEKQMSEAVAVLLGIERQRQLLGGSDDSSEAMSLVVEALNVGAARKNATLERLLENAKLPGSAVTDEQITKAVQEVLGYERQRQLLGAEEADSGGPDAMDLVNKASTIFSDRKQAALKGLIEKARRPGNSVTDAQLQKAVADVLGTERQRQLLGVSEGNSGGPDSIALVIDAAKLSLERKGAALAKLYDSRASDSQISQATADYVNAKQQLRQLGIAVPEAGISTGEIKLETRPARNQ